jgi:hypothetical protein
MLLQEIILCAALDRLLCDQFIMHRTEYDDWDLRGGGGQAIDDLQSRKVG